jgi:hypothetical protein
MRNSLNLGGGAHGLIGGKTTLGVDQVGCEDGVDQGGFTQTGLTWKQGVLVLVERIAIDLI